MAVLVCELEDAKLYGHNAAIVLSQIRFWLQKAKNGDNSFVVIRSGKRWLAHSREKLCSETAFTPKQLRLAIETLRKAKVIEVEQHLFWGKNVSHFYLVPHELSNAGAMAQIKHAVNGHAGIAPTVQPELAQTGLLNYKESNEENNKESFSIDCADAISGKKEEKKKCKSSSTNGDSFEHQPKEHPLTAPYLHQVFRRAMYEKYPERYVATPSPKEWGQLRNFITRCPSGKAGVILDYAVRNWSLFCSVAVAHQAAFKLGDRPNIPQLLQYLMSAVEIWQNAQNKAPTGPKPFKPLPTPTVKAPEPTGPALASDGNPIATLEELEAMFGTPDV